MGEPADVAVIGGGIVGLAAAWALVAGDRPPSVILLEKEPALGAHQSGHNSGVIHSGVYYRPGSQKAEACREGRRLLLELCAEEGIAHEICGKVIVATRADELPALERILERARQNGIACEAIGPERLRELEPHAAGLRALHVPGAGIVDYPAVCRALARRCEARGARIVTGARVRRAEPRPDRSVLVSDAGEFGARFVVSCAGLHSDRVARACGAEVSVRIVPFRGEYYRVAPRAQGLVRNLIYPVPDPSFPFLGVHFTRLVGGALECGPNAVLALAREGYRWTDVSARDLSEALAWPGLHRLVARHWRTGFGEAWRSLSRSAFARALRRLVPGIRADDLVPAAAGVRAQALARDGSLLDDFLLVESARALHVCNAPSPAATASLAIGRRIAERVAAR
jgi:L-2-hydroxyglutarate oxidase